MKLLGNLVIFCWVAYDCWDGCLSKDFMEIKPCNMAL